MITGPNTDDDDEILAGVGFGPNFYKLITRGKGAPKNYTYPHRKGYLGEMPSTGVYLGSCGPALSQSTSAGAQCTCKCIAL